MPGAGVYSAELDAAAPGQSGEEEKVVGRVQGEAGEEWGEGRQGEEGVVVDPEGAGGVVVVGVPPNHSPPPRLAGRSCVYLLQARQQI